MSDYLDFLQQKVNFNRQYGAAVSTLGRRKLEVMVEHALAINPELRITTFPEGIQPDNIGAFLDGVDLAVDAVDAFAVDKHPLLVNAALRTLEAVNPGAAISTCNPVFRFSVLDH